MQMKCGHHSIREIDHQGLFNDVHTRNNYYQQKCIQVLDKAMDE